MNIASTKVSVTEQADHVAKAEVLDGEGAVLWLWDVEDLHDILLFHPDLITFDESDTGGTEPGLRRVGAVAGKPIRDGRDLFLSTAPTGLAAALADTNISMLVTNTDQNRQEIEDGEFDSPCLTFDLYEPVHERAASRASDRSGSSKIVYAYLVGDSSSRVGLVLEAFATAFGDTSAAELLIYSNEPDSIRSVIDEHWPQDAPRSVRIEHFSSIASVSAHEPWRFDVLLIDHAPARVQPIAYEAALRGKRIVDLRIAHQNGNADDAASDPSLALASDLLAAARQLAGNEPSTERDDVVSFARAPTRAKLARRFRWMTKAPLGEIQTDGLSGVGWVTRWNVKCGIGDHAAQQIESYRDRHLILAPREESPLAADDSNVFRCWSLGLNGNRLEDAADVVFRERLACVVIHFNWGFYNPVELSRFVRSIRGGGRVAILDMHSTTSHRSDPGLHLGDFADCFEACDRVLVHQAADAERVKAVSPHARVAIEPLGITLRDAQRKKPEQAAATSRIACFGFCLPNKGIEELVVATWMLRQSHEDVRLLLLNAEHPAPQSRQTVEEVQKLISRLKLSETVTFITDYLDEAKCLDLLSEAELIVNPYQQTGESASAAVRFSLASTTPVLVTPLPIFDELDGAVFRAGGTSPAELAKAIKATLAELKANSRAAAKVEVAAERWREVHDLRVQTRRIIRVAEIIRRNRRAHDWLEVGAC
jgi:glycosyltransferase involved in cell wall biosynthesis